MGIDIEHQPNCQLIWGALLNPRSFRMYQLIANDTYHLSMFLIRRAHRVSGPSVLIRIPFFAAWELLFNIFRHQPYNK